MSIRLIAFFFGVVGFILNLLVTISVPVIKSIYLLHISSNGGTSPPGSASSGHASTVTPVASSVSRPSVMAVAPSVFGVDIPSHASPIVIEGLTKALVLNALVCGFAGLGLLLGMALLCCNSKHAESIIHHALSISSPLAMVSFWLNLIVVLLAHQRIGDYTDGEVSGQIGNALWIALGSPPVTSSEADLVGKFALACGAVWSRPTKTKALKSQQHRKGMEDMGEAHSGEGITTAGVAHGDAV